MELIAIGALLFIFINVCLGIFCFADFLTANELRAVVHETLSEVFFIELIHANRACLTVLVGESVGIGTCMILLIWIIYRVPLKERLQPIDIPHDHTTPMMGEDTSVWSSAYPIDRRNIQRIFGRLRFQRLAEALETYSQKLKTQWEFYQLHPEAAIPTDESTATSKLTDDARLGEYLTAARTVGMLDYAIGGDDSDEIVELEAGIELATVQRFTDDEPQSENENNCQENQRLASLVFNRGSVQSSGSCYHVAPENEAFSDYKVAEETVIQLVLSSYCRRRAASYYHAIFTMSMLSFVLVLTTLPYYVSFVTLNVVEQIMPYSMVHLNRQLPVINAQNRTTLSSLGKAFSEAFECQFISNHTGCFIGTSTGPDSETELLHICQNEFSRSRGILTASLRPNTLSSCMLNIGGWIDRRQSTSGFRISLLVLMYSLCISLIIRKLALNVTSTSTQTYPRNEWWRGVGDKHSLPTDIGLQCRLEQRRKTQNRTFGIHPKNKIFARRMLPTCGQELEKSLDLFFPRRWK
ncbi:hypothetical protein AHF37_06250 [Paragonimus kellicotti]|nr:hypothetical protein AHF37_06250 [Paragonimus kellicotti]